MSQRWVPLVVDYLSLEALTNGVKNTFWALCSFAYGNHVGCYPGQGAIAKRAGCSRKTVNLHIRRLASLGLVTVLKEKRGNYYILMHKVKGKSWGVSIEECVASLPPAVHEYKTFKQFLAEERAKPKFTQRQLRVVKADIKAWAGVAGLRKARP